MNGKQTALMPGNEDRVGYWLTPPDLMAKLQAEFDFDFDACPYPRPAGFDGLKEPWGERTWVNPPFNGGVLSWARKAVTEAGHGKTSVLILPIQNWQVPLFKYGADVRHIGVVDWKKPDGSAGHRSRFHNALFILRPKKGVP